jgi:M protein repeat family protein
LKTYEDQCQKLLTEIAQLESSYNEKMGKVKQLSKDIEQAETRLRKYHEEEEYYKKLEKDNQKLEEDKQKLKQEKGEILSENQHLTNESQRLRKLKNAAQEEAKSLRERSFLQRLFNK